MRHVKGNILQYGKMYIFEIDQYQNRLSFKVNPQCAGLGGTYTEEVY